MPILSKQDIPEQLPSGNCGSDREGADLSEFKESSRLVQEAGVVDEGAVHDNLQGLQLPGWPLIEAVLQVRHEVIHRHSSHHLHPQPVPHDVHFIIHRSYSSDLDDSRLTGTRFAHGWTMPE